MLCEIAFASTVHLSFNAYETSQIKLADEQILTHLNQVLHGSYISL
jgi:hypothetical protein